MKIIRIYVLFLLAILSACGNKNAIFENKFSLEKVDGIVSPKIAEQFLKKSKIPKSERIKYLSDLQETFKKRYIGYSLKEKLIGKHPDKIFANCIEREAKFEESTLSFQFYDNVLICLAELRDTHIEVTSPQSTVATVIADAKLVNNKLIITALRDDLIKKKDEVDGKNQQKLQNKLNIGDEIQLIDGKIPSEAIREMEKYISDSSNERRKIIATTSLFYRNFNYPKKRSINFKIKNSRSESFDINIDWFIDRRKTTTLESRIHLNNIGIDDLKSLVGLAQDYGISLNQNLFTDLESPQFYLDSSNREVLRMGLVSIESNKFCYLQPTYFDLRTDDRENHPVREKNSQVVISYIAALSKFLTSCENEKNILLLDLRSNSGGIFDLSKEIFSMLEIKSQSNIQFGYAWSLDTSENDKFGVVIKEKKNTKSVFSGKIISVTSAQCISACDLLVSALKLSQRATIVGEPTNGASFATDPTKLIDFKGDFDFVSVRIPNFVSHVFNVTDGKHEADISDFKKFRFLENNPTMPDISLAFTENDITNDFIDYKRKILELIQSK